MVSPYFPLVTFERSDEVARKRFVHQNLWMAPHHATQATKWCYTCTTAATKAGGALLKGTRFSKSRVTGNNKKARQMLGDVVAYQVLRISTAPLRHWPFWLD